MHHEWMRRMGQVHRLDDQRIVVQIHLVGLDIGA